MNGAHGRSASTAGEAVIAVDGGASKTDAALIGMDGALLNQVRGPGSNPQLLGWREAAARLTELRDRLVLDAPPHAVIRTHLYLAGLDLPHEVAAAEKALSSWEADVIDNDIFALLHAGTRSATAIAIICGTGMNAVGVTARGRVIRYPALGALSGDWGGGDGLGRAALWHAARAIDGRGPATSLTIALPRVFGLQHITQLVEAIHLGRLNEGAFSQLTPVLFAEAEAGDSIAAAVVDRQIEEIALLARATLQAMAVDDHEDVPLVLGGGVVAACSRRLMRQIADRVAQLAPTAVIQVVDAPPVLGAGVAALTAAGAGDEAIDRFRALASSPKGAPAGM